MHNTERFLRLPELINRTSLSRSTIYEYIAIGMFPAPITLGKRAVGWLESEVIAWIEQRIASSRHNNSSPSPIQTASCA